MPIWRYCRCWYKYRQILSFHFVGTYYQVYCLDKVWQIIIYFPTSCTMSSVILKCSSNRIRHDENMFPLEENNLHVYVNSNAKGKWLEYMDGTWISFGMWQCLVVKMLSNPSTQLIQNFFIQMHWRAIFYHLLYGHFISRVTSAHTSVSTCFPEKSAQTFILLFFSHLSVLLAKILDVHVL